MLHTFASLRHPNYRLWFFVGLVANIGLWAKRVGQDWMVLTYLTDHSATAVGISVAMQFVPVLFLSPYAGVLADRLNKRKLLIATATGLGLLSFVQGALVLAGTVTLNQTYLIAFLGGCVAAIDNPVRQTFVSELVPAESVPNAIALNTAAFNGARLIGPGLAGLMLAVWGPGEVFMVTGVTFAIAIGALAAMNPKRMFEQSLAPRARGSMREAITYVRGRGDIQIIMVVISITSLVALNFQLNSALMSRVEFGLGPSEFGILGSVVAIGSLAGSLWAARAKSRPRTRTVLGSALALGIALGISALAPSFTFYVISTVPIGVAAMILITSANASIQTTVEPELRGRVMALYMMLFLGPLPLGSPLVGWVGEEFGARAAIWVGAIGTIAIALIGVVWAHLRWRPAYRLQREGWPRLIIEHAGEDLAYADAERPSVELVETRPLVSTNSAEA